MQKIVFLLVILSFNNNAMQKFSAQDMNEVRSAIARYLIQKNNSKSDISEVLQTLKSKSVIKDFENKTATLEDDRVRCRYCVDLKTYIVEEQKL